MTRYTIGRSERCEIVLDNITISRKHADLEPIKGGRFILRDQGSSHGTHIYRDGEWIEILEIEVDPDTLIRMGEHETSAATLMKQVDATGRAAPAAAPAAAAAPSPAPSPAQPAAAGAKPAADKAGGPNTLMWVLIGGGALLVIIIIAVVAALTLDDGGPGGPGSANAPGTPAGTTAIRERLVQACTRGGKNKEADCRCAADIILKTMKKGELDLVLRLQSTPEARKRVAERLARMTPDERSKWLARFTEMGQRMRRECNVT